MLAMKVTITFGAEMLQPLGNTSREDAEKAMSEPGAMEAMKASVIASWREDLAGAGLKMTEDSDISVELVEV